jgi:hypothetical protein
MSFSEGKGEGKVCGLGWENLRRKGLCDPVSVRLIV